MLKKSLKSIISVLLVAVMIIGLSGCNSTATAPTKEKTTAEATTETITIKFLSNLPDRTSGQGRLEQTLIDSYMKENPNVKIEVEALQDEPYKQKFKVYAASNEMPDIFMVWGQPSFFFPVMKAGLAAEIKLDQIKDYGFKMPSLKDFMYEGKLYGLPRNTDFMVLYYNKELFNKYKVNVPKTFDELLNAAKVFREHGIAPIAINGKDKWPLAILYQELVLKESGDQEYIYNVLSQKENIAKDPILLKAAKDLVDLVNVGGFQDAFVAADYGAANNLFAQEKAAMYYMGSWEVGMATNPNFSESFKKNVDVTYFPVIKDGKAKETDILAWHGGGYAVSASSKVKGEAMKLLLYMMDPTRWAKIGWQEGLVVPGQQWDEFMTGEETVLQKNLTQIFSSATSVSGTVWQDSYTPNFKTEAETLCQMLVAKTITPEKFLEKLQELAKAEIQ
ncbi:ABC transporter substrate-binding protein [Thermoanaerobacter pentosaceus]|uniref:Raffinose/stachyose/melibiose transport system substrate-binding protein n=1 Tax=Thermoanaerobacter pentosaceus TaxID=694059 RepID=A0ABT9M1Z9_9THEO|nr:extracellular solute-binding protein [Thermoanaerobacter pentosaceus]MDP9750151.1 raffinose/stachyose/melibiose transport system substrate-binding protein [Thermoanaerobacter pentosaceus]